MSWLTLSLCALLLFSLYDVLARTVGVNSKNPRVFAGIYNLYASLLALGLVVLEPIQAVKLSPLIILLTIIGLSIWTLFSRLEYFTHKAVEASVLSIILKLAPVISFILGIIVFQEQLTTSKIIGLVCIIIANIVLISKPQALNLTKKSLLLAITLAVLLALGWTFDKGISGYYGLVIFTFISFFSPAAINLLYPLAKKQEIINEIRQASWRMLVLGACNVLGYAALIKALMVGEASKVTPIATATTPVVVLLGILLLKERTGLTKKLLATLLIFIGIFFLK